MYYWDVGGWDGVVLGCGRMGRCTIGMWEDGTVYYWDVGGWDGVLLGALATTKGLGVRESLEQLCSSCEQGGNQQ